MIRRDRVAENDWRGEVRYSLEKRAIVREPRRQCVHCVRGSNVPQREHSAVAFEQWSFCVEKLGLQVRNARRGQVLGFWFTGKEAGCGRSGVDGGEFSGRERGTSRPQEKQKGYVSMIYWMRGITEACLGGPRKDAYWISSVAVERCRLPSSELSHSILASAISQVSRTARSLSPQYFLRTGSDAVEEMAPIASAAYRLNIRGHSQFL